MRSERRLSESSDEIAGRGKRTVREALLSKFVEQIVSGEIPEGSTLPNEADLTDKFGVSRTSLRETMQYLAALGMIRSRTRAGTVVLSRENWNYLDPLVLDVMLSVGGDENFYSSLIDARQLLEPAAAAHAATKATAKQLARIAQAYEDMVEANARDNEEWSRADLDFHTAIINASGNWVYRQFGSAIRAALLASFRLTNRASQSHEQALEKHHAVLDAIRLRNPEAARAAMEALIGVARIEITDALKHRTLKL
ncbi:MULTISPECIES: FadR/GntR family transcriptional regulator [unclassified Rhizobium]|uniref:FadR/GntR family transcriptional regulator n=1 Tax=unclassified Rhizobium TaxID=2613769 RepID=UPI001613FBB2|nr:MULTISPECIES: FadR/GntR family transcriptional regulator [unclassified Rhizobium]MBB3386172.1 DNA-binding FadR family transcriptional regulator [Rhizobium sp. BK098]MBB3571147.1 DNA-binding FadR family transcriptional regulator [Rhizobium sp. BK491]MBB3617876.1 DNA-binding FadR family transcriptional regulator [Rhizobium sp. BK609]MBB3683671.1 DNA-binding FadR family transcriptional regulator [Rhizobium sp. BK612]